MSREDSISTYNSRKNRKGFKSYRLGKTHGTTHTHVA